MSFTNLMVQETSKLAYKDTVSTFEDTQMSNIKVFMRKHINYDWAISEIAFGLHMEKSSVSARMNYMKRPDVGIIEFAGKRKSRITGITVEAWRLVIQEGLF